MEVSDEQYIKIEDLILNLNECNSGCSGECQTCEPLIIHAIEQGYITREDVLD